MLKLFIIWDQDDTKQKEKNERSVWTILKRYKHAGYTKTSHYMGVRFHGDTK